MTRMYVCIRLNSSLTPLFRSSAENKADTVIELDDTPYVYMLYTLSHDEMIVSSTPNDTANTADSRLEYFLRQIDVFKIEPQRVLCGHCLRWISLDGPGLFMTESWHAHKSGCCGPAVSAA
jgi:hypothetical protein